MSIALDRDDLGYLPNGTCPVDFGSAARFKCSTANRGHVAVPLPKIEGRFGIDLPFEVAGQMLVVCDLVGWVR
jgi:hypothetical protein